jgi:hypothetical protein
MIIKKTKISVDIREDTPRYLRYIIPAMPETADSERRITL